MILRDPCECVLHLDTQVENYRSNEKTQDWDHRLQEERAERAQLDCRTLLNPDSHWVIFPVFLRRKRPHIRLSGLGNEEKEQRLLGRVQMGPPKPLPCAAVAASTSECKHSVENLMCMCVYHEHLLIHRVVYGFGKKKYLYKDSGGTIQISSP